MRRSSRCGVTPRCCLVRSMDVPRGTLGRTDVTDIAARSVLRRPGLRGRRAGLAVPAARAGCRIGPHHLIEAAIEAFGVLGWVPCSRSVVSLDPLPQ